MELGEPILPVAQRSRRAKCTAREYRQGGNAEIEILIQGGEFFPQLTEARLAGASFGGSMLKLSWLGCGLRMEVCSDGQRIITSPVQSIAVEHDTELPGPF